MNFLSIIGRSGHGKGLLKEILEKIHEDKEFSNVTYSTTLKNQLSQILFDEKIKSEHKDKNDIALLNYFKDNEPNKKVLGNLNTREVLQIIGTEFYRTLDEDIHIKFEAYKMIEKIRKNKNIIFVSDDTRFPNEFDFSLNVNQVEKNNIEDYLLYFLNKNKKLPSKQEIVEKINHIFEDKECNKEDIDKIKKLTIIIYSDIEKLKNVEKNKNDWSNISPPDTFNLNVNEAFSKYGVLNVFRPIIHPEAYDVKDENLNNEIMKYTGMSFVDILKIKDIYKKSNTEWTFSNVKKYGYARAVFSHYSEIAIDNRKPKCIISTPIKKEKELVLYKNKLINLIKNNIWVETIDITHSNILKIAFSAGSLFDMKEAEEIYDKKGLKAYTEFLQDMDDNNKVFLPGPALGLYKAFRKLNEEVDNNILNIQFKLITKIPVTFPAFWNSYNHYILEDHEYLYEFDELSFGQKDPCDAHLSSNIDLSFVTSKRTAEKLHEVGIPAIVVPNISIENNLELYSKKDGGIHLISDFDGVIGDSDSERVYQNAKKSGSKNPLDDFNNYEIKNKDIPMDLGPIGKVIKKLNVLIKENEKYRLETNSAEDKYNFCFTIITARSGAARQRFLNTMKEHNIDIIDFHMMNGVNKNNPLSFIKNINKNMNFLFIDDGEIHIERSKKIKEIISGYVVNDYNYEESKKKQKIKNKLKK